MLKKDLLRRIQELEKKNEALEQTVSSLQNTITDLKANINPGLVGDNEVFEHRFRSLIENAPDGIAINDINGRIRYISPSVRKMFGYSLNELQNENTGADLTHPDDLERVLDVFSLMQQDPNLRPTIEYRFRKKDGSYCWIETTFSNLVDDPAIEGYVLNFRDLTVKKKAQQDILMAKEKAEKSDKLKSAFLSNMSHEIRTPMSGIMGFAELLQNNNLSIENRREYIEIIKNSGKRLLNTVNDIIEISKIESGHIIVNNKRVDLIQLIHTQIDFFKPEAQKKGLQIVLVKDISTNEFYINTDATKVNSILSNLIKNALKYSETGVISVEVSHEGDQVLLCCRDNGIGIPKHRHEAIFNRFEQADLDDTLAKEGSGLGLAIVKSYVEMLDGKIWLNSEENEGASFYISLPYS
jgi:PAS domain S-box-containing protein